MLFFYRCCLIFNFHSKFYKTIEIKSSQSKIIYFHLSLLIYLKIISFQIVDEVIVPFLLRIRIHSNDIAVKFLQFTKTDKKINNK